jgi:hypothetical protein
MFAISAALHVWTESHSTLFKAQLTLDAESLPELKAKWQAASLVEVSKAASMESKLPRGHEIVQLVPTIDLMREHSMQLKKAVHMEEARII